MKNLTKNGANSKKQFENKPLKNKELLGIWSLDLCEGIAYEEPA